MWTPSVSWSQRTVSARHSVTATGSTGEKSNLGEEIHTHVHAKTPTKDTETKDILHQQWKEARVCNQ